MGLQSCSSTAGVDIETVVDTEETDRIVNEVVNDAIVAAAKLMIKDGTSQLCDLF